MKTLQNSAQIMRITLRRILVVAAFGVIAIAAVPAQAADKEGGFSDAVYRTDGSQSESQGKARLVPAEFSIGINLGHGIGINFGHGFGHSKYQKHHHNNYYGRSKNYPRKYYGHQKKYYGNGRRFGNNFRSNRSFNRSGQRGFSNNFRGGRQGFPVGRR